MKEKKKCVGQTTAKGLHNGSVRVVHSSALIDKPQTELGIDCF